VILAYLPSRRRLSGGKAPFSSVGGGPDCCQVNKTGPSGLPNKIAQFPQLQTGAFGSSSFHVAHKMLLFTNPMNIKHIEKEFSKNLMPYM
jgi:hypothetical protein